MTSILALVAAMGFSVALLLIRVGGQRVGALTGAGINVAAQLTVAAIPALILELSAFAEISMTGYLWLALVAVLTYPLSNFLTYTSVSIIGAARAAPLWSSAPLFAAILAIIFLGERPNAPIVLGILGVTAGIILVVTERARGESTVRRPIARTMAVGYACGLAGGVGYGALDVVIKVTVTDHAPPLAGAAASMLIGFIIFAPLLAWNLPRTVQKAGRFVGMFFLSGIAGGTAVITMFIALEQGDVVVVAPIMSVSPVITIILAHLFLRRLERLTIQVILGTLLAVGGATLVGIGDRL